MVIRSRTTYRESFENVFSFRMALNMRENGMLLLARETGEVCKCGLMVLDMKDIGKMIKLTAEVDLFMLTGMCMKENGKMTKAKVTECICILMGLSTRENGSKINKKVMDLKLGLTALSMKEVTKTA